MFKKKTSPETIDPRILPLVEALNATGEIETIASCQGHLMRISDPYVYFSCATEAAERLAARLEHLRGRLHYYWQISGVFNQDNKLCFDLRSPTLFQAQGVIGQILHYGIFRKRIDRDLSVLQENLCKAEAADSEGACGESDNRRRKLAAVTGRAAMPGTALCALILILALSACATDKREIQHDPSGSDEMLKSPCACMPVPYEGPGFTWGRG